jgi:hypothetical protein
MCRWNEEFHFASFRGISWLANPRTASAIRLTCGCSISPFKCPLGWGKHVTRVNSAMRETGSVKLLGSIFRA